MSARERFPSCVRVVPSKAWSVWVWASDPSPPERASGVPKSASVTGSLIVSSTVWPWHQMRSKVLPNWPAKNPPGAMGESHLRVAVPPRKSENSMYRPDMNSAWRKASGLNRSAKSSSIVGCVPVK